MPYQLCPECWQRVTQQCPTRPTAGLTLPARSSVNSTRAHSSKPLSLSCLDTLEQWQAAAWCRCTSLHMKMDTEVEYKVIHAANALCKIVAADRSCANPHHLSTILCFVFIIASSLDTYALPRNDQDPGMETGQSLR
eukprot:1137131-Pelagomonas_calceolata.AAC.1